MLDNTLIISIGPFGRTPTLGKQGGRDHFPRAWTTMLAGGGTGGQVIGSTSKQGTDVVDRPISAVDFMSTVCTVLDIDYKKEFHTREGRPIRPVDKGEKLISELMAKEGLTSFPASGWERGAWLSSLHHSLQTLPDFSAFSQCGY